MEFIETFEENHALIDRSKLFYLGRGEKIYSDGRSVLVRACHDIFIGYKTADKKGILMIKRDAEPAKDFLWCFGGGVERGVILEESLKKNVMKECGLNIKNIQLMGVGRLMWSTDPVGNGKGEDDLILTYFAEGEGAIQLDSLQKAPHIIDRAKFENIKDELHPYVKKYLDEALIRYDR